MELTILMPCLNEALTVESCIRKARAYLDKHELNGEVLIADNGSTDGSQAIDRASGPRVVQVTGKGYGAALIGGIEAAHGQFVVMGDADDSYDFTDLDEFLDRLRLGNDVSRRELKDRRILVHVRRIVLVDANGSDAEERRAGDRHDRGARAETINRPQ